MKIKERVKANVCLNAHPLGLEKVIENQFKEIENKKEIEGAKNVLIIGGSSGYGLATRIVADNKMNANTFNVCFENAPDNKRSGTAGFWNVQFFNDHAKNTSKDFNVNAFEKESKEQIAKYLKENNVKIDLVVYSLAAGVRPKGEEIIYSSLNPIGKTVSGKTIDVAKNTIKEITIEPATQTDIDNTVYVMGGEDWYNWIETLKNHDCLTDNVKTYSYTYIGGKTTKDIYRDGTIGKAKEHLEATATKLKNEFNVDAFIVSSKAICSKASVFIPSMPIYAGALYNISKETNTHENVTEHIYRLFSDMIYGDNKIIDEEGRIRLDNLEMDEQIQKSVLEIMNTYTDEELLNLQGMKDFIKEFYNINGFRVDGIDYEQEVDIDSLLK